MRSSLALFGDVTRMIWRRRLWFLVPLFSLLALGVLLLVVLESPTLLPFFYAIF